MEYIISHFCWKGSDNGDLLDDTYKYIISHFCWKGSDNAVP